MGGQIFQISSLSHLLPFFRECLLLRPVLLWAFSLPPCHVENSSSETKNKAGKDVGEREREKRITSLYPSHPTLQTYKSAVQTYQPGPGVCTRFDSLSREAIISAPTHVVESGFLFPC